MSFIKKIKNLLSSEFAFFMITPALMWQFFFVILPLLCIAIMSILGSDIAPGLPCNITFVHYHSLFNLTHLRIVLHSIALAIITAFGCLLMGYPVAYFLAFKAQKIKKLLLFLLIVPFWSNLLILIYSWFFILDKDGILNYCIQFFGLSDKPLLLLNTMYGVSLVMFYCYLPFMIIPIFNSLDKLNHSLIEASLDLGATYGQTFCNVIVPLSYPGVRTGFFLVFVVSFGEFVIPLLVGGDKYMFVGTAIAQYILTTFDISSGAAFTCLSAFFLIVMLIILNWFLKMIILGKRGRTV